MLINISNYDLMTKNDKILTQSEISNDTPLTEMAQVGIAISFPGSFPGIIPEFPALEIPIPWDFSMHKLRLKFHKLLS